jgi:hypothetical protein
LLRRARGPSNRRERVHEEVWFSSNWNGVDYAGSRLRSRVRRRGCSRHADVSSAGRGSISIRRNTHPRPAASCPTRDYGPTISRNTTQHLSIAGENAQERWADSALRCLQSQPSLFCRDAKHEKSRAGRLPSDCSTASRRDYRAHFATLPNK